jgi:hypothetical protein
MDNTICRISVTIFVASFSTLEILNLSDNFLNHLEHQTLQLFSLFLISQIFPGAIPLNLFYCRASSLRLDFKIQGYKLRNYAPSVSYSLS